MQVPIGKFYRSNKLYVLVFSIILTVDTLLRLVLYHWLIFERVYRICGNNFYFFVTLNRSSSGSAMQYILASSININLQLVGIGVSYAILGVYIALMKNIRLRLYLKILFGAGLWMILCTTTVMIVYSHHDLFISDWLVSWFKILGTIGFIAACLYFSSRTVPKFIWVVALVCGVCNLINHFYRPYYIIDYMYLDFLYRSIRLGIVNLADLIATVANMAIIVYIIYLPIRYLSHRKG
jgi:hypothetical protein